MRPLIACASACPVIAKMPRYLLHELCHELPCFHGLPDLQMAKSGRSCLWSGQALHLVAWLGSRLGSNAWDGWDSGMVVCGDGD